MYVEDCCEILDSMRVPITASDREEGEYPYYGANGIQDHVADYIFDDELVLLAEDGGNFGSKERPIAYRVSGKCWVNNHAHVLKPKAGLDVDYLCYSLMFYKVDGMVNGATRQKLTQAAMRKMKIPSRSMNEQLHIVDELNRILKIKEQQQRELTLLDDLIKARFVELFGDPFNNKKWDTQKLRNISASISDGSNVDKTYYEDKGDVLFLRIQNVWFNEFRLDDSVYISEDVNNEYLYTSLHHGDLLITKIGRYYTKDSSLGRVSVYLGEDDKANYSNNIMRVRLTDEVCSEFVNILMNLDDYNRYIREVSVGGTDKRALSKAIIGDLPIIMPPKELQFEFLEFVRQTDKSKFTLEEAFYIESQALELLKEKANQDECLKKADKAAVKVVSQIFTKAIYNIDSNYNVDIKFY